MAIVVLGSINLDIVVKSPRMPLLGETLMGESVTLIPGGKGANQAVAVARLAEGEAVFVGKVGSDTYGSILRQSLLAVGVDVQHLDTCDGASGVALITVDSAGNNSIIVVPGANATVDTSFIETHRALIEGADILLLQLEIPMESVELAAQIAAASGTLVVLDPAPARSLSQSLVGNLTWITPNLSEALLITGRNSGKCDLTLRDTLLDDLLELGARNVLLKLGEDGLAIALRSGERFYLQAHTVDATDTTAAGDALNGGFAVGLAEGMSPFEAATFANAVAALSVTKPGAQPSMPLLGEVGAFLGAAQQRR